MTSKIGLAALIGASLHGAVALAAAPPAPATTSAAATAPDACAMEQAQPWIERWFAAWTLVADDVLHLPKAAAPELVFFDDECVWTTAAVTAPDAAVVAGPKLLGATLPWRVAAIHDTLTLPDGTQVPPGLMSFAAPNKRGGEFFVMPAPSIWAQAEVTSKEFGSDALITSVFVHEFSHTRQVAGFDGLIKPIEKALEGKNVTDDLVQQTFGEKPGYRAAFEGERDALFAAASAGTLAQTRELAQQALTQMQTRHATWFTHADAAYATLDDVFLSFEGAGQFASYAWLVHPEGGGFDAATTLKGVRRGGRFWSQDEGLALFLVLDAIGPQWREHAYATPPDGAIALLQRALGGKADTSQDAAADHAAH